MWGISSARKSYPQAWRVIDVAAFTLFGVTAMNYLSAGLLQRVGAPQQPGIVVPDGLIGDEWTGGPKECDLFQGISEACLYFD
jgi:hypothetical protein